MKVLEYMFPPVTSRSDMFELYPLGDIHIGALNCAEKQFRRLVQDILHNPRAYWVGGGDMLDAVILQDQKRFDPACIPSWMLSGKAASIQKRLMDMVSAQRDRFLSIVEPIKDRCIGLLEGNHEYAILRHHNRNITKELCDGLGVPNLTDCAFVRMKFQRNVPGNSVNPSAFVRMFITHGCGGGRTAGAEPNHLARMAADKACEIALRGHSHVQHILPPVTRLTIPTSGVLNEEPETTVLRAANWGAFVKTYAAGNGTYDSRAQYPVRTLQTIKVQITPFRTIANKERPKVIIAEVEL